MGILFFKFEVICICTIICAVRIYTIQVSHTN